MLRFYRADSLFSGLESQIIHIGTTKACAPIYYNKVSSGKSAPARRDSVLPVLVSSETAAALSPPSVKALILSVSITVPGAAVPLPALRRTLSIPKTAPGCRRPLRPSQPCTHPGRALLAAAALSPGQGTEAVVAAYRPFCSLPRGSEGPCSPFRRIHTSRATGGQEGLFSMPSPQVTSESA